jgi:hypothetical protein
MRGWRIRSSRLSILIALVATAALVAAGAAGAAIRLGPDITQPLPSGGFHLAGIGCQSAPSYNPCTYINVRSTNPDVVVAAPADGVITSWSFRGGCCTDPQTVAHHLTLGTYKLGTQDGSFGYAFLVPDLVGPTFEIPAGNQVLADPPTTLPARVPIKQGERIGIAADDPVAMTLNDTIPNVTYTNLFNGTVYNGEPYGAQYSGAALQISALVEPDGDGDGFGDETQDCNPADATRHDVDCAPPVVVPAPPLPPPVYIPCPTGGGCSAPGGSSGPTTTTTPPAVPKVGAIPPASDPNSVYITLSCPPNVPQHCGGYLILVEGGAKKAAAKPVRTRYSIVPGKAKKIAIPLTAKLRKTLKRTGRLKVTLRLQPDAGTAQTFTRVLTVKAKKPHAKHR